MFGTTYIVKLSVLAFTLGNKIGKLCCQDLCCHPANRHFFQALSSSSTCIDLSVTEPTDIDGLWLWPCQVCFLMCRVSRVPSRHEARPPGPHESTA